ncbi:MAG: DUF362 domain-containing protein [Methanomassiliicoccales archaeon]
MRGEVCVLRCPDLDEEEIRRKAREAIEAVESPENLQGKDGAVIKPNICNDNDWTTGVTTCPFLIEEMVDFLRDNGVEDITLAEGSLIGQDTMTNFQEVGLTDMAERRGLRLIDLNRDEQVPLKVEDPHTFQEIEVARTVVDAEYLVNMPVMKTHVCTTVTLGMKNLKGVISDKWKRKFHFNGLEGAIADLGSIVSPDLNLVDGLVGMQGQGPLTGTRADARVLVSAKDLLTTDATCCRIMGFDPSEVEHVSDLASTRDVDLKTFEPGLVGTPIQELGISYDPPADLLEEYYEGVEILWGDPCSGCSGVLCAALNRLEDSGHLARLREKGGISIAVGKNVCPEEEENLILVGRCQYRNRDKGLFIPGCPPPGMLITDMLRGLLGEETQYDVEQLSEEAERTYGEE